MEEIAIKEECDIEYIRPCIDDRLLKTHKKCGEIFVSDEDMFHILCTFCESQFEEIEHFFNHVKYIHPKTSFNEEKTDPLICCDDNRLRVSEICPVDHLETNMKVEEIDVENENNENLSNISDKSKVTSAPEKNINVHKKRDHRSSSKEISNKNVDDNHLLEDEVKVSDINQTSSLTHNKRVGKTENEIRSFKCTYCNLDFPNIPKLNDHKKSHKGEKPFVCKVCGKTFRVRTICEKHENKHNQTYKCKLCPASYTSLKSLRSHSRRHGEKKLSCNYCNKKFHYKIEKEVHERTHTGEKPFQCSECGRCFGVSSHLNDHIKVHSHERPFQCEICNAAFSRKNTLKSHLKIHSNKREYLCKICGKGFNQSATLHTHLKSHEKVSTKRKTKICN